MCILELSDGLNTGYFSDRTVGRYTVQYATVPNPNQATFFLNWHTIGSVTELPNSTSLRNRYDFAPVLATGIRIEITSPYSNGNANDVSIDELELYGTWPNTPASQTGINVTGTAGNDTIYVAPYPYAVNEANVYLDGPWALTAAPDGVLSINGGGGNDYINLGYFSYSGAVRVFDGNGNDTVIGGGGPTYVYLGNGQESVTGGAGPTYVYVGSGTNTIVGGPGDLTVNNYTALDAIVRDGTGWYTVNWAPLPAFGRLPDPVGLRYWASQLRAGAFPAGVVSAIARSPEHLALVAAGRVMSLGLFQVYEDALASSGRARGLLETPETP